MAMAFNYNELLNLYYQNPASVLGGEEIPEVQSIIQKTDDPFDIGRTDYFDPVYSSKVEGWLAFHTELYSLLKKTSYQALGDSKKYYVAHVGATNFHGWIEAADLSSEDSDVVDITDLDNMNPAVVGMHWRDTLQGTLKASWQKQPPLGTNPEFTRKVNTDDFVHQIDAKLFGDADTPAYVAGTSCYPERLDAILSGYDESKDTAFLSSAGDGDLLFGEGGLSIDRSADSTDIYSVQLDLPATAVNRRLTIEMIDDIMADAKQYSANRNYIAITDDKQLNNIQRQIDPKQRFLHSEMSYQKTLNGVQTRQGVEGGFPIGGLISNGISMPVFTTYHCHKETDDNSDVGDGNFYIVDMDEIELRMALPTTYLSTDRNQYLSMGALKHEHALLAAMQLIPGNPYTHAAIKYLT